MTGNAPPRSKSTRKAAVNHAAGHRSRLRGRLVRDARSLADYEILELVLGQVLTRRDTKPLAKDLLARFGNLRGALDAPRGELLEVDGFGPALADHWLLLREFYARYQETPPPEREAFTGPDAVARMAVARLGHKRSEEFWLALLDNKNRLISWQPLTKGTVDKTAVYPREAVRLALEHRARSMILVHNHPGGDPRPSDADMDLTRDMVRAAAILDIQVLDHVIVAGADDFSFQAQGLL